MIQKNLAVQIEANSDRVVMAGRLKSVTPTDGKRIAMVAESWQKGELSHQTIHEEGNTVTMKRSAGKKHETRHQLTDSSQTTHQTPTTTIIAECL